VRNIAIIAGADVVVDPDGRVTMVSFVGFEEVDFGSTDTVPIWLKRYVIMRGTGRSRRLQLRLLQGAEKVSNWTPRVCAISSRGLGAEFRGHNEGRVFDSG